MSSLNHENKISYSIIAAAIDVPKALGPGLLESAYKECLFYTLNKKGLYVEKEKTYARDFRGC
jgi:GxxExxY protein